MQQINHTSFSAILQQAISDTFFHLAQRDGKSAEQEYACYLESLELVFTELFNHLAVYHLKGKEKLFPGKPSALMPTQISLQLSEVVSIYQDISLAIDQASMVFESIAEKRLTIKNGEACWKSNIDKKEKGVYYTPVKLAQRTTALTLKPILAAVGSLKELLSLKIVDPSCGTGIFIRQALHMIAERYLSLGGKPTQVYKQIAPMLYGVDINPMSIKLLKGVVCLESKGQLKIADLATQFKCGDAILGGQLEVMSIKRTDPKAMTKHQNMIIALLPDNKRAEELAINTISPFCWELEFPAVFAGERKGFDAIIGNPPWGKIKPAQRLYFKHEDQSALAHQGAGLASYLHENTFLKPNVEQQWLSFQSGTKQYAHLLKQVRKYYHGPEIKLSDSLGDLDYYKFFMERMFSLLHPNGRIGIIIPSSFGTNAGAAFLRNLYLNNGCFEHYYSYINKKRIFSIHPMFRFLQLIFQKGSKRGIDRAAFNLIDLVDQHASDQVIEKFADNGFLDQLTGELNMVPELSSSKELMLLKKLYQPHPKMGEMLEDGWNISFNRELDMTLDSGYFITKSPLKSQQALPMLEGRMVHQYDHRVKGYRSGTARSAVWEVLPFGERAIEPHYYVNRATLDKKQIDYQHPRAGFCDISGHQNERTLLAALIPAETVCSNKVPTCCFEDNKLERHLIWIAYANSLVADWIIRRWVSTTINFFYLKILPFPRLEIHTEPAKEIIHLSNMLSATAYSGEDMGEVLWKKAQMRARIDTIFAQLFGLNIQDLEFMLKDFPILDSQQNALEGESRSSITADLIKLSFLESWGTAYKLQKNLQQRIQQAKSIGSIPYLPSSLAKAPEAFLVAS